MNTSERLKTAGALTFAALAVFITGAPAGFVLMAVYFAEPWFIENYLAGPQAEVANRAFGVLVALALFVITATVIPAIWRKTANPKVLRLLAFIAGQLLASAAGLLLPWVLAGLLLSWVLGGLHTVVWWAWQRQWRGAGLAPSLLAGVLRPRIHPGQIWYAQVPGAKQSKVRPVLVLQPADGNRWHIAYFTSTDPQPRFIHERVKARSGTIRGMSRETWVQCADTRVLSRQAFRSYNGLAPLWLYTAVCAKANIAPHPDVRTIDENFAGDRPGPLEEQFLTALGLRSFIPEHPVRTTPVNRPTVASLTEAAQFLSQAGRHHLGVSPQPKPKRARRPEAD